MAHYGKKNLNSTDISDAKYEETQKLINDNEEEEKEDDDFFLRGPTNKKTVRFATEKIKDVKVHIAEVTDIMRDNVGRLMDRGDRLDDLNERSENLSNTSDQFKISSRRLQRKMWLQNLKSNMWIIIFVILIALLIIIPVIVKYRS